MAEPKEALEVRVERRRGSATQIDPRAPGVRPMLKNLKGKFMTRF